MVGISGGDSSRELVKLIEAAGGYFVRATGDHYQFKHPTKPGKVTIPHPEGLPCATPLWNGTRWRCNSATHSCFGITANAKESTCLN
ncbi:type II toxin-antitoxin system HicA family toxin [Paenibacillus antibioticophila]|uniref:type II toxin-antitoxin system HicA family toxin n=1 Tax=Paenibacillus antibioticophila TaxID=1274374 RepID=UPI001BB31008|nr:type II toxin-antitoxin system HicA family toxin [Paenibacillus antibioticophila]